MDGASTHSAFDELDFGTERHSSNIPVDVDLPPFEVLPRRCWVGKVVDMKNESGVTIASGIVRNHHTVDLTTSAGSLSETHVPIQVSRTHVPAEAPDDWRYCVRPWPMGQVIYRGISLLHHRQRENYTTFIALRNRPIGVSSRSYSSLVRVPSVTASTKSTLLLTEQSVNSVAGNVCCARSCVQHFQRRKIKVLRDRMYLGTSVQFRRHMKLDVHRQFHLDSSGRNVVTLDGTDVCPAAWQLIMGVSETSFYDYARDAAAGVAAQPHGNTGRRKPRSHTVVATAALRVILNKNADHMPHKSRLLPSGETTIAKILPANFKWRNQIPALDSHLAICGLPKISPSGLSNVRKLHFSDYSAKRPGDNFARCSVCDEIQTQRKLQQPGSQSALLWQRRLTVHLESAWAHRELYYSNRYRSQLMPDECVTIMHDKMDHSKTASPVLSHKTKHLDGLMKLPISVTGMLAHGHGDVRYAHYGLDIYPHDVNYTVGSFARLLRDLERIPKSSSRELFVGSGGHPLFRAILRGASDVCLSSLPPAQVNLAPAKRLPPVLHVQMDNAVSDNKNRFVFCFWSLLVAKGIFREVYVNFMLVGHTHDDIDALFGRWSMALKKEDFPTIPLLMKSFMDNEAVPTIPHLIEEVPDFKSFISDGIADGEESLQGHTKAHQLKFFMDSRGCPMMKYKILCHHDDWLPREGGGIKIWKEDAVGQSLWPRGEPSLLQPRAMRNLPDVIRGLSGFISYWDQQSREDRTGEYRRRYEPLSNYWRSVRDALALPLDLPPTLRDGFWPRSRVDRSVEDEFTDIGDLREEFDEDDPFVGQARDRPAPSFRVGRDVYEGYFVALRPCEGDERPVWFAQALSNPNSDPERPNSIKIQYYKPTSRDASVQANYGGWDSEAGLQWKIDHDQLPDWEHTESLLTAWKPRVRRDSVRSTVKIPRVQVQIILDSLEREAELHSSS